MQKLWKEGYRKPAGNGLGRKVAKNVIISTIEMCKPLAKSPFHIYSRVVIHVEVYRVTWLVAGLFLAVLVKSLRDL